MYKKIFDVSYHVFDESMIPNYIRDKAYIRKLIPEVYSILEEFKDKSPIAINDFALWLHGFNDEEVYNYLYKKNKFQIPSIDIFAQIDVCSKEQLKLITPVESRLIKVRSFNYRANNVLPISYQSGFVSRQQLFDESSLLTIKILDIDVVPFYFLEWLQPISRADKAFIKDKIHANQSETCEIL